MPEPRLVLRPFAPEDDAAMLAWFATPAELERVAGATLRWPLDAAQLQGLRDEPSFTAFTAVEPGREDVPVAHAEVVTLAPGHGRLARVVLDPARRGEGLAKPLIAAVLEHARAAGLTDLELRVFADNAPALRTYLALGFTTREPFPGDDRVVVLRCALHD